MADRKRGTLELLYRADPRVRRWTGTAHGVLQAVNTYEHHAGAVRGDRVERNNLKTVNGDFGQLDRRTWRLALPDEQLGRSARRAHSPLTRNPC